MGVIDGGPVMTVYPPQGMIILSRHAIQSISPYIICRHELCGHRSHGSVVRSSLKRGWCLKVTSALPSVQICVPYCNMNG